MRPLLLALLAAFPGWACSCNSTATPCSGLGGSSVIFVAEVRVDSGEDWGKGPAKVAIIEALQNVPEGLKEADVDTGAGTSCHRRLKAGERYVIITEARQFSVAGCNPTFELRGNEHILDAMRSQLRGGAPRLVGTVLKRTGPYSRERGISQVAVELTRGESRYTATTDGEGRYIVAELEPGRYKIRIWKDGYVPDDEFNRRWSGRLVLNREKNTLEIVKDVPGEIEIFAKSCQIRDLALWPEGHIQGVVRGRDGTPLPGVSVQAFGFDRRGKQESTPLHAALTDSGGKYDIQPLPPGQYLIGVNASPYEDENPYPPTLYAGGRPVHLGESASVGGIDLALAAPRTPARLRVKVLTADGQPQKGATVRLETPSGVERWFSRDKTDDNGELVAAAYVGQSYKLEAFHYTSEKPRSWQGFASVNVTGQESAVTVVLQLKAIAPSDSISKQ